MMIDNVEVTRLGENYYQITSGRRWWTLSYDPNGLEKAFPASSKWTIQNETGRTIKRHGDLGSSLVNKVHVFQRREKKL